MVHAKRMRTKKDKGCSTRLPSASHALTCSIIDSAHGESSKDRYDPVTLDLSSDSDGTRGSSIRIKCASSRSMSCRHRIGITSRRMIELSLREV
jgi:hypothetical protein